MIRDDQNQYSDAQALTLSAASEDIINHGADRDLGIGEPLVVRINLDVLATATNGNETYTAILQTDDNASFTSATQVGATVTITRGAVAGSKYYINVPPDTLMEQYSRLYYTLGGTSPTVTLTADLLPLSFVQNDQYYADNITIS
jgi:hypothetical protein